MGDQILPMPYHHAHSSLEHLFTAPPSSSPPVYLEIGILALCSLLFPDADPLQIYAKLTDRSHPVHTTCLVIAEINSAHKHESMEDNSQSMDQYSSPVTKCECPREAAVCLRDEEESQRHWDNL